MFTLNTRLTMSFTSGRPSMVYLDLLLRVRHLHQKEEEGGLFCPPSSCHHHRHRLLQNAPMVRCKRETFFSSVNEIMLKFRPSLDPVRNQYLRCFLGCILNPHVRSLQVGDNTPQSGTRHRGRDLGGLKNDLRPTILLARGWALVLGMVP